MRDRFVDLDTGRARLVIDAPAGGAGRARGLVLLGHGAGAGRHAGAASTDLGWLAGALPEHGWLVARMEQPWLVAGKRIAAAPATLDRGWLGLAAWLDTAAAGVLRRRPGRLFVVGGRSAGARVACRTADRVGADAVLALAFPLHPPGCPERSRADELTGVAAPTLVLQGERDPFGGPGDLPAGTRRRRICPVPGADHSLRVGRADAGQERPRRVVVTTVTRWLARLDAGR